MRRYYYTISALPLLSYEEPAPFPVEDLYYMCRGNIAEDDYAVLIGAGLEPKLEPDEVSSLHALSAWYAWETALRNELIGYRAQRLGWETDRYLREGEVITGVLDVARNAASQDSPLVAEDVLNRARWGFLDELETGHFFELTNLVVFSLKLQLLHRKDQFTREKGEENFKEIYQKIREDIRSA